MNVSFKAITVTTPSSFDKVKKAIYDDRKDKEVLTYGLFRFYLPGRPAKPATNTCTHPGLWYGVSFTKEDLKKYHESQGLKLPDHIYENKGRYGRELDDKGIEKINEACRTLEDNFIKHHMEEVENYYCNWIKDQKEDVKLDASGQPIKIKRV